MSAGDHRRAVIFDMDGVLVHTTPLHLRVWEDWFASVPYDPGPGGVPGLMGRRGEDVVAEVMGVRGDSREAEAVVAGLYERLLQRLAVEPLPLAPGANALLERLAAAGARLGLATSGRRDAVDALVGELLPRFDAVVTAEDVTRGKPDPQVYDLAAARLGVAPAACTVVEDAVAGVAAARAAGMRVAAVTATASAGALAAAGADVVAARLDELVDPLLAAIGGDGSDGLPAP
ncbi:MAG TPA: HAD family phosphatase [Egibacteraceae bacterium]